MGRLRLELKGSRKPLAILTMRGYCCSLKVTANHIFLSRKSDIENERRPPKLVDADSEEGKALISNSLPTTPSEPDAKAFASGVPANGVSEGLERIMATRGTPLTGINTSSPPVTSPGSPAGIPSPGGFKRGHSRQASLGTTMTSPSTRRRSLESTMSLIQGVLEGDKEEDSDAVETLTSRLAGSSVDGQAAGGSSTNGR